MAGPTGPRMPHEGEEYGGKIPCLGWGTKQVLTVTSSSQQSARVGTGQDAAVVRLCADIDCWIDVGTDPTADSTKVLLPAYVVETLKVDPGDKIAALRIGSDNGNLSIVEMT